MRIEGNFIEVICIKEKFIWKSFFNIKILGSL